MSGGVSFRGKAVTWIMAEWFTIEVFSGDKLPASAWRYSYEDALTEAAATSGALYWDWHDSQHGVVFEMCFSSDDQWQTFRALPTVVGALDAVPDPVNGLLVYRGRGGAAGSRKPRPPRPAPSAAAMELDEPRTTRRFPRLKIARRIHVEEAPGPFEKPGEPPPSPAQPAEPAEPARDDEASPAAG